MTVRGAEVSSTIARELSAAVAEYPDDVAVYFGAERRTFSEYQRDVREAAQGLLACGLSKEEDQSKSGFSTDARFPCFFRKSLNASTASAFNVASRSTARIFKAFQPSAFIRTSTDLNAPGSRARGPVVFGLRPMAASIYYHQTLGRGDY